MGTNWTVPTIGEAGPGYASKVNAALAELDGRVISVTSPEFGAVGDGVTDDTAAIQAALDAGGKLVFVPAGTFKHAGISVPAGVELVGAGKFASILEYTGTTTAVTIAGSRSGLRHLRILGSASATGHLVDADSTARAVDLSWLRLEDVSLETWGTGAAALHLKGSGTNAGHSVYFAHLENLEIKGGIAGGSTQTGVLIEDGSLSGVNRGTIVGGDIQSCTVGVHIDSSDGWIVSVPNYEGNGTPIKLTGSGARVSQANLFLGFVCESSTVLNGPDVGANCNDNWFIGHATAKADANAPSRNHYWLSGIGNLQVNRPAIFSDTAEFTVDGLGFVVARNNDNPAFDLKDTGGSPEQWRIQVDASGNFVISDVLAGTNNLVLPNAGAQSVTGSRAGNAALASLLTALANNGLIVDNTTA